MKKLKTVDADTLLYQPLDKPSFVVDGLIPTGLTLFCGAQKIGKSWLMLKLCLCVSEGRPLWELPSAPGDVLYLCLEDTFYRIQDRLFRLTDEASDALAVVVVHHIRKQGDSDIFNRVSGTTGLTGSADATFVLEKEHRASDTAALYAIGRDIEYQEFTLRFRDCSWELVERKSQEQLAAAEVPPILFRLVAFMEGRREWSGTATELLTQMGETDTAPNVITKLLNEYHATVLRQNNVRYVYRRTKAGRRIVLSRGDGVDSGDGLSGMPSVRGTAVTPVL